MFIFFIFAFRNKLLSTDGQDLVMCEPSQLKEMICRAFSSAYFFYIGKKREKGFSYTKKGTTGEEKIILLNPTSALCQKKTLPEWIIFQEVTETTRTYASVVSATDPQWIIEYAPEFWLKIQK